MALTIVVLAGADRGAAGPLTISLDQPRIVIGRSDGCEVRLPDPSVSPRHAQIRQRGAEYLLLDEGSQNGTFLDGARLALRTATPLRSGDHVRVGRIWLEIRVEAVIVKGSTAAAAKELALALAARGLAAQGEDPSPRVVVVDGPDRGRTLRMEQAGRPYILGRAKDTELPLDDPEASRRHVAVTRRGDQFTVQDLGSRAGASLDGDPIAQFDTPWRMGQVLAICRNRLVCEYPAAEALMELERGPCEPIRADEVFTEPTADPPPSQATPTPEPVSDALPASLAKMTGSEPSERPRGGWGLTDAAILLMGMGVLALSVAALAWLFGRG